MTRALLALVVALLATVRPTAAVAEGADYAAFKTAFMEAAGAAVDAQIARVEVQLAGDLPADARAELARGLAELKLLKKRVEDVSTVEALWDSVKNGQEALAAIAAEAEQAWGGSVHLGIVNAEAISKVARATQLAGKAVDYGVKLKKLADDLDAISTAALSPGTRKLSQSLTVLSAILANFGEHTPLVGAVLKGYGDLTSELLKTTLALDARIEAREGGQLLPGVHGDRAAMLDGLAARKLGDAQRVDGLRDVFRTDDGRFVIWDRAARDWALASEWEPGLTAEELTRRYVHFAKRGITEPTPEQVVRGYRKVIVLELVPAAAHVAPGKPLALRVTGRMLHDDQPIERRQLFAAVTLTSHTGVGEGELQGAERVQLGETVTWIAPHNLDETYVFAADLAAETGDVASSAGPATATVRTGTETRVELTADVREAAAGQPVTFTARLRTAAGDALPATVAGTLDLTAAPALGYFTEQAELAGEKGATFTWMAPAQAGTFTFTARYGGATSYALFGSHTAASEATVTVTVGAPQDAGADGDAAAPADAAPTDAPEPADAALPTDDGDAPPIDWPGVWRGRMKTTMTSDAFSTDTTQDLTLQVKVVGAEIHIDMAGQQLILTRTPSNPRAATGRQVLPRTPVAGATITRWDAWAQWTAFLADGKLNLAMHMEIHQTLDLDGKAHSSSTISDSIGQLSLVR